MKVLLIGSGGREHAIAWKLRQSPLLTELYCAPGNPGIAEYANCIGLKVDDLSGLVEFAIKNRIDLTIVGPEYPLSLGIVDMFQSRGLKIFGPTKAAARLESSKSFAKEIMVAAGVPTARYEKFDSRTKAVEYLNSVKPPIVIKADGLAAGKGVFVCLSQDQIGAAISQLYSESDLAEIVVEQYLEGREASYIVATDGERIVPLAASNDYKRLLDGDAGPNTGGMGTVSPTSNLGIEAELKMADLVIRPVLDEMKKRGMPYCGFLYAGLMKSNDGTINVLEFNARLGDPETQVIMRRLDSDFLPACEALAGPTSGSLPPLRWKVETSVCVVLASQGYPERPRTGDEVTGLHFASSIPSVVVFHAGTSVNDRKLYTAGGRVLNVTAIGKDLREARERAYRACDMIQFRGRQLRRDIGL